MEKAKKKFLFLKGVRNKDKVDVMWGTNWVYIAIYSLES